MYKYVYIYICSRLPALHPRNHDLGGAGGGWEPGPYIHICMTLYMFNDDVPRCIVYIEYLDQLNNYCNYSIDV